MKKIIRNLSVAVAALMLTCSFTAAPTSFNATITSFEETPIGGAYLVFAGKRGGEVSTTDFKNQKELAVDGCAKGSKIFQFTLHITAGGKTTTMRTNSNKLTDDMVGKLEKLNRGDEFEFKNMKAYLPNGKDVVDVHGWKYTIV